MKYCIHVILLIIVAFTMNACLKGRIPVETIIPVSRVDSVFLQHFRQTSGVIAAEGTTSLPLSDGRTLWLFGKAHLNDYNSVSGMMACMPNANNAAMLSDVSMNMSTLNVGNNDFIPSNETGKWFIPLHAYQYNDTVYVFAKKQGGISLNTRTYIVKYRFPDFQYLKVDSMSLNQTMYGYTSYVDTGKGFCYVYGIYRPDTLADNALYVARFPMNDIHSKWQYYAHNDWVDVASAAQIIAYVPGENFSVRKIKSRYVLLTQAYGKACNKGTEIYAQSGANPWGDFLNYHLIHTIGDSLGVVTPVCYGVTLHPQYLNSDNEVLITYSINGYGTCIPTCTSGYDNPDYYRIRTLRVGLKKIDVAF
ncbi:MAG: hypothetical protein IPI46_04925 [Bacteroidetes bacterium]|nr:hypothetical protein [Bacteroidota bacterium]